MPRYAAIDIGSNSVRMQAAEVLPAGGTRILASDREVTRLGSSVFSKGSISADAMKFVCQTLSRMAETYRKLDVIGVRAVATSAVRDATNQQEFIERASEAAGTQIETISGQEEARLIHLGVQSRWPHPNERILIVDVGGGSAEIILGESGKLVEAFSKPLGAVRLNEVFLKSDPPADIELHRMHEYIEEKLAAPRGRIRGRGIDRVIATSATAAAIVSMIHRISREKRDAADRLRATTREVRKAYQTLAAKDLAHRRKMAGIGPRRAEIIVAGVAVFLRVLEDFQRPSLYYSAAGVRDGIIADLAARGVGRELSRLSREQRVVVEKTARRYGVSVQHARQVANLAHTLFDSLTALHGLAPEYGKLLEAAAYLHDIGHYVSDVGHHKHSYYLVVNSDMPGFTKSERTIVGMLCRYHRKAMPAEHHDAYNELSSDARKAVLFLAPLLRIADSLDRSHEQRVDHLACHLRNGSVVVQIQAKADTDLEQWAGERAADIFREVYDKQLSLVRAK
jgi:exopolyphosphatase / guanosine-5'-triphosphate,3'-diphosphate pyrophosphatase